MWIERGGRRIGGEREERKGRANMVQDKEPKLREITAI